MCFESLVPTMFQLMALYHGMGGLLGMIPNGRILITEDILLNVFGSYDLFLHDNFYKIYFSFIVWK